MRDLIRPPPPPGAPLIRPPPPPGAPFVLTLEYLRDVRGACAEQVDLFQAEFPRGMEWTEANLQRCAEIGMDLAWYALRAFTRDQAHAFLEATAEAKKRLEAEQARHRYIIEDAVKLVQQTDREAVLIADKEATVKLRAATLDAERTYAAAAARAMFEVAAEHAGSTKVYTNEELEEVLTTAPPRVRPVAEEPGGIITRFVAAVVKLAR